MPKKKEPKPWTFTIEEFKIFHSHPAKCECSACLKVKEYYGRDLELEEILSKYEGEVK